MIDVIDKNDKIASTEQGLVGQGEKISSMEKALISINKAVNHIRVVTDRNSDDILILKDNLKEVTGKLEEVPKVASIASNDVNEVISKCIGVVCQRECKKTSF